MSTIPIYDRTTGRTKQVAPEKARELRLTSPGKYADGPHVAMTDADWARMTSGERLAAGMVQSGKAAR